MKSKNTQAKHLTVSKGLSAGSEGVEQSGSGLPNRNEKAGARNALVRWIADRLFTIILVHIPHFPITGIPSISHARS